MSIKDKLLGLMGKAIDEAMTEAQPVEQKDQEPDIAAMIAEIMARLDALEGKGQDEAPTEAQVVAEVAPPIDKMDKILDLLTKLAGAEQAEQAMGDACKTGDADTVARAEILAPGLANTPDIKRKALDAAYATADGKQTIDILLAGKTMDTADTDVLFIAASEMLKQSRRGQLNVLPTFHDSKPVVVTAEELNRRAEERWKKSA